MKRAGLTRRLRQFVIGACVVGATWLCPVSASAQEEKQPYDARLENYKGNVTLDTGSTALTWFLFIVLAGLCVGVMFKNANRSHLD